MLNFADDLVQSGGHQLMHFFRFVSLDKIWSIAITAEQLIQLLVADTGENAGIGDLIAIQMENRQNCAVARRIQELIGMPARRQRSSLRLAIADNAGHDQIRIIESGSIGVRKGVAELTAFVN